MFQVGQERRPDAGGPEGAADRAALVDRFLDEAIDLLHLQHLALHAGDLADTGDTPAAVRQALELHDDAHGRGDLTPDARNRHRHAGHADHLLEALDGVARGVGVHGGHGALVAGVHGLEHIEGLVTAALADDDPIGPHAQRVLHEFPLAQLALALGIGGTGFQPADVRELQLQFRCILDGDDALVGGNMARQRVEQRGLAAAGAAGNDQRHPAMDRRLQHLGHRRPQRAELDQALHRKRPLGKFADGRKGSIDRDRTDGDVDARTVRQAGVAGGRRLVDAPADRRDDLVNDAQQMRLVLEVDGGLLELAEALDKTLPVGVDQDIGDGRVLEQRLDRPEPGHLVDDVFGEGGELALVQRDLLGAHILADIGADFADEILARHPLEHGKIELVDDPGVKFDLLVQQRRPLRDQFLIEPFVLAGCRSTDNRRERRTLTRRQGGREENTHQQTLNKKTSNKKADLHYAIRLLNRQADVTCLAITR